MRAAAFEGEGDRLEVAANGLETFGELHLGLLACGQQEESDEQKECREASHAIRVSQALRQAPILRLRATAGRQDRPFHRVVERILWLIQAKKYESEKESDWRGIFREKLSGQSTITFPISPCHANTTKTASR